MIATAGRPSLTDTLAALTPQLASGDEILVERLDCPWGHQARNNALPRCAGSHLMFIDDDDKHLKDALDHVRAQVRNRPRRVHLFSMAYTDGRVVNPRWPLQVGYVSTQMLCVPNSPGKLGQWGDRYEGDYDFADTTMQLRGDEPVLHSDVIALIG